ncbi:hypothetical protein [Polyangium jinanense]|uniref:Uncharacterized protein n=1 Tax=Polyangium jinanense TaxID=2829994 RepID=A0A9X3X0X4_9BACT|nr:hypothetical protein [Polyangium jinanense]MDC3953458.1 hypothetical protein [Polyangium jinanense]MDC3979421.1 hypothetical protein [Polyangium jinanense]
MREEHLDPSACVTRDFVRLEKPFPLGRRRLHGELEGVQEMVRRLLGLTELHEKDTEPAGDEGIRPEFERLPVGRDCRARTARGGLAISQRCERLESLLVGALLSLVGIVVSLRPRGRDEANDDRGHRSEPTHTPRS